MNLESWEFCITRSWQTPFINRLIRTHKRLFLLVFTWFQIQPLLPKRVMSTLIIIAIIIIASIPNQFSHIPTLFAGASWLLLPFGGWRLAVGGCRWKRNFFRASIYTFQGQFVSWIEQENMFSFFVSLFWSIELKCNGLCATLIDDIFFLVFGMQFRGLPEIVKFLFQTQLRWGIMKFVSVSKCAFPRQTYAHKDGDKLS